MKGWLKVSQGWYDGPNGEVIQCWWRAIGSPKDKAGWYLWPDFNSPKMLGPFKTMREAIKPKQGTGGLR